MTATADGRAPEDSRRHFTSIMPTWSVRLDIS